MNHKLSNPIIFVSSIISLIISLRLFWNLGIFSDEYNLSPDFVLGNDFWLYMNWLTFPILLVMCFISLTNLKRTKFTLCSICILILLKLFWNTAIFSETSDFPTSIILGGNLGVIMDWLRLGLITVMFILSFIDLFASNRSTKSN